MTGCPNIYQNDNHLGGTPMTEQAQGSFEQSLSKLNTFLDHAMKGNLTVGARTIHWSVRIRMQKLDLNEEESMIPASRYRYTYPRAFLKSL